MPYTERFTFTPDTSNQLIYDEHLVRYQLAGSLANGKRVLDVACGTGYGSKILAQAGAVQVKSVDIDEQALVTAKQNYHDDRVTFIHDSAESLSKIDTGSIDLIVSFETIEHLYNQAEYLQALKRVLAPDGLALISTPNKAVFGQKNPFHVKELTRSEFEAMLTSVFQNVRLLNQVNGLSSAITADTALTATLSNPGEAQYFIAVCSQTQLPDNIKSIASQNPIALKNWQNNPGWKLVNTMYRILVKLRIR